MLTLSRYLVVVSLMVLSFNKYEYLPKSLIRTKDVG